MRHARKLRLKAALVAAVGAGLALAAGPASAAAPPPVTDPATSLPAGYTADIVVDNLTTRVFIAQPGHGDVVVVGRTGTVLTTITGIPHAYQLTQRPLSPTLYVSGEGATAITKINTITLRTSTITMPDGVCPYYTTYTGGRLWFTYQPCGGGGSFGFGYLDPASDAVTTFPASVGFAPELVSAPNQPSHVFAFEPFMSSPPVQVWSLASTGATLVAQASSDPAGANCQDAALINGGAQVILACGWPYEHLVYNTSDATLNSVLPSNTYPNAVAVSADGRTLALGVDGIYWPDAYIQDISAGLPGTAVTSYDFGYALSLASRGLAWSATGLLYAIQAGTYDTDPTVLHIYRPPTS